jgi:feruloyl esterase
MTRSRLCCSLALLALLTACASPGALLQSDLAAGCASLAGRTIPASKISLPSGGATIDSAVLMAPAAMVVAERGPSPAAAITPATPQYCKLLGHIAPLDPKAPDIHFQVNLPTVWNGRAVQYGGGGFNGTLITGLGLLPAARYEQPSPLALGFVTYGTDSGHQNQAGQPPQAFALNSEALVNFAHASYKKVRDVSMTVMRMAYAEGPTRIYFFGSSEGGREGLTMAQRYPDAFNGIFSRVPVIHWTGLQHAGLRDGIATMGPGWLRPAQVKRVHDAVLAACDSLDGLADGLVSDPVGCRKRFDIATLRCNGASADDTCLTPAQEAAVRTLQSPLRLGMELANGQREYPGRGPSGEATPAFASTGGWNAWWLGSSAPSLPPQQGNGIAWFYGAGAIQYFYARDPAVDLLSYKPDTYYDRVREVSALMDSTEPDLSTFQALGGKLLMLENMADYAQSPYAGIRYFENVQRTLGKAETAEFARLYTAPGVDHVGSGAPANVDMLGVLADWVEKGQAPGELEVSEQKAEAPSFAVVRALPLCQWPAWPHFKSGPVNAASSFSCAP